MIKGVPHPTGYPTYILLGKLFQLLPLSTPVYKAVLESLVPTAIGAGLLTGWMVYVLGTSLIPALIAAALAGISWGVAPLIYSQAVIIEVHGLQSLIVVLVLWWITLNLEPGTKQKWLFALSFLVGLGIGNHLTILLFLPAALVVLIYKLIKTRSWKPVLLQVSLVIAGMLVYLYLPVSAHAYPAVNWGNPQTWSGFLWEVNATPYHGFLLGAKPALLLERLRSSSGLLFSQFGPIGLVAGVIGIVQFPLRHKWPVISVFRVNATDILSV
jgi:4-amino-4-deoxy-L-arabinose transferase-like glycosyltransferase